jgi:AraC-like DNA-binding protein
MVWARRPSDVRLLGAALLLMSGIAALISARLAGLAPASVPVEHAINLVGLCTMPLVVLYARYAVAAPVTPAHAALWIPAAIYLAGAAGTSAAGTPIRISFIWILPVALAFTAATAATVWWGPGRRPAVVPPAWIVAFMVVLNAAQIVRMSFGHVAAVRAVVPLVLCAGFVLVAVLAVWRAFASTAPRYERSGLDASQAPELLARIDRALTHDRLFARADLTLSDLAAAAEATPHQVSEVLNQHARVSFADLVNRCRVEDVKIQLLDAGSERFTIEGIGASAGFGSRSALYAAFRRFERTTPTRFRDASRR